jgi:ATP synthase A chain
MPSARVCRTSAAVAASTREHQQRGYRGVHHAVLLAPVSLALRLWGNIFAGGIMVAVIGLLPPYILWLPNAGWKLFDMFIGVIQALIFTLLTLIYFSESVGSEDEHAH